MSFTFNLSQVEIEKALRAHVATLGLNTVGKDIKIELSSTRKPAGYAAVVTVADQSTAESSHALDNATVAEASNLRTAVIKQTGTDALGHAAENKEEIPSAPVAAEQAVVSQDEINQRNADAKAEQYSEDLVDLPAPTPEAAGHESPKSSLFE